MQFSSQAASNGHISWCKTETQLERTIQLVVQPIVRFDNRSWTTGCIVYTNIQPVVKPVKQLVECLFTRCSWLFNGWCKRGLIVTELTELTTMTIPSKFILIFKEPLNSTKCPIVLTDLVVNEIILSALKCQTSLSLVQYVTLRVKVINQPNLTQVKTIPTVS